MQLAGTVFIGSVAVQSSNVPDASEIGAGVLLGLASLFLIGSGFIARRKAKGAKGNLRLVGGSALLLLVGLAIYDPVPSAPDKAPTAKPTPTVATTTAAVEASKTFATCDEATAEFNRLYDQALEHGSEGDVAGMTATAETQYQTTLLNKDCFPKRGTTAVTEMLVLLKKDSLPAAIEERLTEPCRPVVVNAVRLLSTAVLRKAAGDGDAATMLGQGIERLGADDRTCLPQQVVDDFKLQLDKARLGSTTESPAP